VYGRDEGVSIKGAITMHNGDFLTREEKMKGTLEAAKLADMIALPGDLLNISPDNISNMKVGVTIVGAKVLYEQAKRAPK